ncbi:MAG: 2-hydroxychromene-2-carboxylate isomerase [Myxococcota bacterium]
MIRFQFDYLSPYAYLAWTQIHALAARHGRTVVAEPTLLAALLAHGQTKGPAEIPAKRLWVGKDTLRTARLLGVPLVAPPTHPFNPLTGLRVTLLVDGEDRRRLVDALFRATWGGGGGIATDDQVARVLTEAGFDGPALVARAGAPGTKLLLREATERSIAEGVFGVPTMIADGEAFWGYDAFGHLERFLRGEDSLTPEDLQRWQDIRPSAVRR